MLQKLLKRYHRPRSNQLTAAEEFAVIQLAAAHSQFRVASEDADVQRNSQRFLGLIDGAASALQLKPASRAYRASFTINYQALFPGTERSYRVDVLEASRDQHAAMWVNGEKFKFSEEALRRANVLQSALTELGALLERWAQPDTPSSTPKATRKEVKWTLTALDIAWACFEDTYISELIAFEVQARSLIVQAIDHDRNVQVLEKKYPQGTLKGKPFYHEEQTRLMASIARLNSVANIQRKNRDNLQINVLFDAYAAICACDAHEADGQAKADARSAARLLATDILESFAAMRSYLREVQKCLERLDCHLANNPGLVARLVDVDTSWEIGVRYIQNQAVFSAFCALVAEIKAAGRIAPELMQMISDCDVELFLCLPRIVWLCFLIEPARYVGLLKLLLPQRFITSDETPSNCSTQAPETPPSLDIAVESVTDESVHCTPCVSTCDDNPIVDAKNVASIPHIGFEFVDVDLRCLSEKFQRLRKHITNALPTNADDSPADRIWNILIRRIVLGPDNSESLYTCFLSAQREAVSQSVEELMHELERWSMELQRHCPEDWNQCIAILVHCLECKKQEDRKASFCV